MYTLGTLILALQVQEGAAPLAGSNIIGIIRETGPVNQGFASVAGQSGGISRLNDLNLRLDLFLRDQRRPVGNNLFNLGSAPSKPRDGRWPSKNQWRDLFGESFNRTSILTTYAHA